MRGCCQVITNSDITIFNHYYDTVSKVDIYQRKYLYGVHFEKKKQINNNNGVLSNANYAEILIPFSVADGYLKPKQWLADKTDHWTLKDKDIIVDGIIDYQIDSTHPLSELIKTYDDVFTIFAAEPIGDHWEVTAK